MSDGKVYAFPTTCLVGGIVYNKDLFKKVGFVDSEGKAKAPETWDEVIEVSKKIRKQEKSGYCKKVIWSERILKENLV